LIAASAIGLAWCDWVVGESPVPRKLEVVADWSAEGKAAAD